MICNIPCRIILFVINFATTLLGIVILVCGALMAWGQNVMVVIISKVLVPLISAFAGGHNAEAIRELVERVMTSTAPIGYATFTVGCLIFGLSILGYLGACHGNKKILKVYASLLGFLAFVVLVGIILYFSMKTKAIDFSEELFSKSIAKFESIKKNNYDSLVVGFITPALKCCGLNSADDFVSMSSKDSYDGKNYTDLKHPIVCCKFTDTYKLIDTGCPAMFDGTTSNVWVPCKAPFRAKTEEVMTLAAYGLIGVFAVMTTIVAFTGLTICVDVI